MLLMTRKAPESREERLAAKLRENLKRRKQQARARTVERPETEAASFTPAPPAKPDVDR
jgi:hypothetical protein